MISQRPAEAEDRAVPGHWEGDLIIGLGDSAIAQHFVKHTHPVYDAALPPANNQSGPASQRRSRAGRARRRRGPRRDRCHESPPLPEQLRRSLTWDQGAGVAGHRRSADPGPGCRSTSAIRTARGGERPRQRAATRGTYPGHQNLTPQRRGPRRGRRATLDGRPRKTLGWRTPAEALNEYLATAA